MEGKTNAIAITIVVLILLFIIIVYKIRSDKARKSLTISSEPHRNQNPTGTKGVPDWVWSIICLFIFSAISLFFDSWLQGKIGVNSYAYYLYGLLSGIASFFILRQNPKSIWYVTIIINSLLLIGIFAGDYDPAMTGGLIIGLIGAIIGFIIGKTKVIMKPPRLSR